MNETELRRLSELRALLEGFAARHAAARAALAPETLDRLRLVLRRLSEAACARDYAVFRQADFELHETMINLAAVPLLHEAWLTVWNGLRIEGRIPFEIAGHRRRTAARAEM